MQQAVSLATQAAALAKPPAPTPTALWSERYKRWHEPGTSPISGLAPPAHGQFKTGVEDPRRSKAGIVTARTRELMEADNRLIDRIARRWLRDCERGDNRAREQLLDRTEGPVVQRIDATVESRYVIEEFGVLDVPALPETPVSPAQTATSDNTGYDAHSTGETKRDE